VLSSVRGAAVCALVGYGAVQVLGRRAGSTAGERRMRLPGDDLVVRPQLRTDHAVTIDAPPEQIWPWLTQMGWHLGGYYTPAWVDRLLFRQNWPSLDHLDPALLRDLEVGDTIPDGPPGTAWYIVTEVDAPDTLVLRSTTHLPPGWRDRFGARIDWTWSVRLTELSGRRTRLQLRVRGRMAPPWVTAVYVATIVPADYVMARGMLRGIKRRAEACPVLGPVSITDKSAGPAHAGPTLTPDRVWKELERSSFAVLSYVTPGGKPRSSGVLCAATDHRLYVVAAPDSWKARHIATGDEVAVTVPIRRGSVLSLIAPIPPATVSLQAAATVHPAGSVDRKSVPKKLAKLLPKNASTGCLIELAPTGRFTTYGIGVSLLAMATPAKARAHAPVR